MSQKLQSEVRIQIPKHHNYDLEVVEEKSDVHILLIILVILSIPIVMGRIRNLSYPTNSINLNDTFEDSIEKPLLCPDVVENLLDFKDGDKNPSINLAEDFKV